MKEDNLRVSYVGIATMQEGFQSERNETSQTVVDPHEQQSELGKEFHIKYPVQSLLTHFKVIFNDRFLIMWFRGFKVTEVFPGKVMLVRLSFCDRVKYILSGKFIISYLGILEDICWLSAHNNTKVSEGSRLPVSMAMTSYKSFWIKSDKCTK